MSLTPASLLRAFGGVAFLVLVLAPSAHATFGEAQPFNLAGAGPSRPASVAGSEDGTIVSVWPADPGLSWSIPRPPAAEVAFQRADGSRATFGVGAIASATRVGLTMDRRGTATIVWENDRRQNTIFVARCTSRGCTRARRLGVGRSLGSSALAVDREGRVLVVWRGRTNAGRATLLYRAIERGRLGVVRAIGESGGSAQLAASGRRFTIAWRDRARLRTTVIGSDGRAARPQTAASGGTLASFRLVGGDSGVLAAWRPRLPHRAIAVADVNADGLLMPAEFFPAERNAAFDIAAGPTGEAVLAWCPSGPRGTVMAATRVRGGRFGAPEALGSSRDCEPSATIADTGRATVGWVGFEPAWQDIGSHTPFAAEAQPGAAFGDAVSIDTRPCPRLPTCAAGPQELRGVAVTAAGRQAAVVWVSEGEGVGVRVR